jgi:hypothetical protein
MYSPESVLTLTFSPSPTNGGHHYGKTGLSQCGLEGTGCGGALESRLGLCNREHHARRQLQADGPLVVEVHLHFGVRQQITDLRFQQITRQVELLERLLVHEDVSIAVVVQVLHRTSLDEGPLDLFICSEALVVLGAGFDVLHFHLHERTAATAHVHVVGLEHAPDALVPFDQITRADFGCQDFCHQWGLDFGKKAAILPH